MEPQFSIFHVDVLLGPFKLQRRISQGISYVASDQMKMAQILRTVKIRSKTHPPGVSLQNGQNVDFECLSFKCLFPFYGAARFL